MGNNKEERIRKIFSKFGRAEASMKAGDMETAEKYILEQWAEMRELYEEDTSDERIAKGLIATLGQVATFYGQTGRHGDRYDVMDKQKALLHDLLLKDPSNIDYGLGYANVAFQFAQECIDMESYDVAKSFFESGNIAVDHMMRLYPDNELVRRFAQIRDNLSRILEDVPDSEEEASGGREEAPSYTQQSIPDLIRAVENGEALSAVVLGYMYLSGNGVEEDLLEAKKWFERAREMDEKEHSGAALELLDEKIMYKIDEWEENTDMSDIDYYLKLVFNYDYDIKEQNGLFIAAVVKGTTPSSEPCEKAWEAWQNLVNSAEMLVEEGTIPRDFLPGERTEKDFLPYMSFRSIYEVRKELAIMWLRLKKHFRDLLSAANLKNDESILDAAESGTDDEGVQILLVSIVEAGFEVEGVEIANQKAVLEYEYNQIKNEIDRIKNQ